MGVDFLKSKCKAFSKTWDAARLQSNESRLFSAESHTLGTSVVAKSVAPHTLHDGDEVLVRVDGDGMSIIADLARVAILPEPRADLANAIRESGGYARGTVQAAYPTLGLLKVEIR